MFERREDIAGRVAGAIDLLVDFATLGEYGLVPQTANAGCADGRCELDGRRAAWEALATPRRGAPIGRAPASTGARARPIAVR